MIASLSTSHDQASPIASVTANTEQSAGTELANTDTRPVYGPDLHNKTQERNEARRRGTRCSGRLWETTVEAQYGAGAKRCLLTGQKHRGTDNFAWLGAPVQRKRGGELI